MNAGTDQLDDRVSRLEAHAEKEEDFQAISLAAFDALYHGDHQTAVRILNAINMISTEQPQTQNPHA